MEKNKYTVSIILTTFNRSKLLDYTLDSIIKTETDNELFEVIIIDDGSTDSTFDIIKKYNNLINLKYIYHPDNGYQVSRCRNLGLKLAEGNISIIIDCGVLVCKDFINQHIKSHMNKTCKMVVGYVFGFANDESTNHELLGVLNNQTGDEAFNSLSNIKQLFDIRESVYELCDDKLCKLRAPWAIAWSCNISVKTNLIKEIGGYDEYFTTWGAEDLDFALSLFKRGVLIELNRKASSIHYPHPKSLVVNTASSKRNKRYLHEKHNLPETKLLQTTQSVELNSKLIAISERNEFSK